MTYCSQQKEQHAALKEFNNVDSDDDN